MKLTGYRTAGWSGKPSCPRGLAKAVTGHDSIVFTEGPGRSNGYESEARHTGPYRDSQPASSHARHSVEYRRLGSFAPASQIGRAPVYTQINNTNIIYRLL